MSALVLDAEAIRRHVMTLYGSAEDGWIPLWHAPSKRTTWVRVTDHDAIVAACLALGTSGNLYHGVGLHPTALGPYRRGEAASVCGIPGLWAEVDLAGPGHTAPNLPPAGTAQGLITGAVPLPPSYVVTSGHGLHLHWLFTEFWSFASEDERRHAVRLAGALQWLVIAEARRHGWHVDTTSDLARVLRPAGTINRKPGLPERPVRVLQEVRRRYSVADLDAVLPLDDPAVPRPHDQTRAPRSGSARAPAALWSRITADCSYMAHCVRDAPTLSEPEWHAMMSVLARCLDGEALAHRISRPYPRYDVAATSAKVTNARAVDAPMRCATIRASRGGEPWCGGCPFFGRIASPIELGYLPGYDYALAPRVGQEAPTS